MRVVVSKINFFDNDLKSEVKSYTDLHEAYVQEALIDEVVWLPELDDGTPSIENIKQSYFDMDSMINIIEV